jgi:hypothetical protein
MPGQSVVLWVIVGAIVGTLASIVVKGSQKEANGVPRLMWVPPCRKQLERDTDYPKK